MKFDLETAVVLSFITSFFAVFASLSGIKSKDSLNI